MDKIILKDLSARGIIGVYGWERTKPQELLINIELFVDLKAAGRFDDISESVNYQIIANNVLQFIESANRFTVEALAADIAQLCLDDERVQQVLVRIEKPSVISFTRSVGVEITRSREDFSAATSML
jgi:FolB domain-containing protein